MTAEEHAWGAMRSGVVTVAIIASAIRVYHSEQGAELARENEHLKRMLENLSEVDRKRYEIHLRDLARLELRYARAMGVAIAFAIVILLMIADRL